MAALLTVRNLNMDVKVTEAKKSIWKNESFIFISKTFSLNCSQFKKIALCLNGFNFFSLPRREEILLKAFSFQDVIILD